MPGFEDSLLRRRGPGESGEHVGERDSGLVVANAMRGCERDSGRVSSGEARQEGRSIRSLPLADTPRARRQARDSSDGGRIGFADWRAPMELNLECEREEDGRWLAEVPQLPGVLVYGSSANEAMAKAEVLALRVLAEQIEQGEARPQPIRFVVPAA